MKVGDRVYIKKRDGGQFLYEWSNFEGEVGFIQNIRFKDSGWPLFYLDVDNERFRWTERELIAIPEGLNGVVLEVWIKLRS